MYSFMKTVIVNGIHWIGLQGKKGGQTLSDPHEIKPPMAEHQAARGVLTKRPLWPPE